MSNPAPGWYPAPHANNEQRYWDGNQWTEPQQQQTDPNELWSAVGKPLTGIGAGRYKLTAEYLYFEKGALSTKSQQIFTADIFDVDAAQTLQQKARGIGTITLFVQRASGDREKVVLEDVPNFREGVSAINSASFAAREGRRTRENTQHVNYQGGSPVMAQATPTPTASPAFDLNAELAKLGALKAQGILDDEEFTAAKRQLLGL